MGFGDDEPRGIGIAASNGLMLPENIILFALMVRIGIITITVMHRGMKAKAQKTLNNCLLH
jgi:hypothetical protein